MKGSIKINIKELKKTEKLKGTFLFAEVIQRPNKATSRIGNSPSFEEVSKGSVSPR
jgi:hypothetical protein